MTHLDEALRLAGLGWHVFALGPTGKPYPNCKDCKETCQVQAHYEKCDHLVCHATYAGTTDPARLAAMWDALPHSLIGLRTGAPSGLVVIDFDLHDPKKDGRASANRLRSTGKLERTVTAKTGGGGLHLYYRHPGVPVPNDNTGKLGPGADMKGDGGFVLVPPSAKRGKLAYSWVPGLSPHEIETAALHPDLLASLIKPAPEPQRSGVDIDVNPERLTNSFEEALDLLRVTGVGGRNENLYRAACRGGEVVAAGLRSFGNVNGLLREAAAEAGMGNGDGISNTIRSGLNRGMSDFQESE